MAARAVGEQGRALDLRERGFLRYVADDPDCPTELRLAALGEEFGEVCRAVHDGGALQAELIQLAGVALAWATVA